MTMDHLGLNDHGPSRPRWSIGLDDSVEGDFLMTVNFGRKKS